MFVCSFLFSFVVYVRNVFSERINPGLSSGTTLETAISQHQAGRLDQAKRLYSAILSQEPRHAVALNFLGIIAYQQGDARQQPAQSERSASQLWCGATRTTTRHNAPPAPNHYTACVMGVATALLVIERVRRCETR